MSSMCHIASLLLAAFVIALAAPGRADPAAQAAAEMLFAEGNALYEAGDFAAACPKFEAAVRVAGAAALGGKLRLAEC
jgi:hypothetical protein